MIVADVGGANPLDTSTLGHRVTVPEEWFHSIEFETDVVFPPGSKVGYDLAQGTYKLKPKILEIEGWIEPSDGLMATLRANMQTIRSKFGTDAIYATTPTPPPDVEISFPEDDPDIIGVGRIQKIIQNPQKKAGFVVPARGLIIQFEMKDPTRYDISAGRPGTPLG